MKEFIVETSARHIHLSREAVDVLFGKGYELTEGVIAAKRHIHLTPEAAADLGVADKEIVNVKVNSDSERSVIFGDVVVRVSEKFAPAMHIDTDEANACYNANCATVFGTIVK